MVWPVMLRLIAAVPGLAVTPIAQSLELQWPVACTIGADCVIQNYVDHDASRDAQDYTCGTLSYDQHNGTDIRLRGLARQKAGVDVLAAADGTVLRVRDGVPDVPVRSAEAVDVRVRQCGNGVVIAHDDDIETQYCHLAQGSVRVRPGTRVQAGAPVGRIGLSGATEYPHLHFTVRRGGKVIDPFAVDAAPGACGSGTSLWAGPLRAKLAYKPSAVLNTGFAPGPVTMAEIESGDAGRRRLEASAPAIVAFARAIGLKQGDVQRLKVTAPDGTVVAESAAPPLDRDKAQWMMSTGRKRPEQGWPAGTYSATYEVTRGSTTALQETFSVAVVP
ncbi:MAG TPA: M23 family metallopeptidase [Beijerinckiaceae bacterium]|nr:M23 family metallopeptidase [Beijerinckiaceae bacterium]